MSALNDLIGQRVRLAGHFAGIVRIEDAERLGDSGYTLRIRTDDGGLHETVILDSDVEAGVIEPIGERAELVAGGERLRSRRPAARLRERLAGLIAAAVPDSVPRPRAFAATLENYSKPRSSRTSSHVCVRPVSKA